MKNTDETKCRKQGGLLADANLLLGHQISSLAHSSLFCAQCNARILLFHIIRAVYVGDHHYDHGAANNGAEMYGVSFCW